ncbi:MAG: sugar phosphate isomerase/epimerase family protein [Enterocloster bolteae]
MRERFGFCLDTGHSELVKRPPYKTVLRLGHRIKILHLHENDGIEDLHQIPHTFGRKAGDGFDRGGPFAGLRATGYDGVLNFETFPAMNSFPESVKEEVLRTIAGIGRYFAGRIGAEGLN